MKADDGGRGDKKDMHGADGESLIVQVPVGTLVKDPETDEILYDLSENEQQVTLCCG